MLQGEPGGQRLLLVVHRDVVEPEKASAKNIQGVGILAVDPPRVIEQQFVQHALEEGDVSCATLHPFGAEFLERTHRMHRRVGVAECPFVGWNLPIRMHVAFRYQQLDQVLGEADVELGEGRAVEGQIPGGEPRIFSFS